MNRTPKPTECALQVFMYTNVYPRTPTVMRDCIYIIRVDGHDESVPYAYGMYAAIVYAQPMFIPRTRNIYPRTPTFTPHAPIVMRDCIYTIRYGRAR